MLANNWLNKTMAKSSCGFAFCGDHWSWNKKRKTQNYSFVTSNCFMYHNLNKKCAFCCLFSAGVAATWKSCCFILCQQWKTYFLLKLKSSSPFVFHKRQTCCRIKWAHAAAPIRNVCILRCKLKYPADRISDIVLTMRAPTKLSFTTQTKIKQINKLTWCYSTPDTQSTEILLFC